MPVAGPCIASKCFDTFPACILINTPRVQGPSRTKSPGKCTMRGLLFLALALPLCSCTKDTRDIAQELGLTPAACGKDDNRLLQASFDGSSYCADVQLAAIGDGTSVIITGVALSGNTLVLQLDTLAEGTHAITEASNGVLLVRPDGSWTVSGEQQGSLTIDHHDQIGRASCRERV